MTTRISGLAVVGYGLTAIGFLQVAATIAPRVADSIPQAGPSALILGVAVALAVDIVWAALMHTTLTTYRNGQPRPALGFGTATGAAVVASTALLASIGHMGPWSVVPILAAILLVADGIREHVTVSPHTAKIIRERTAAIRDARALAAIEARHDAHTETINGYRESSRLSARTAALAEIKTSVQRAEWKASQRIKSSNKRYAIDTPAVPAGAKPETEPKTEPDPRPTETPVPPETPRLTVVQVEDPDKRDAEILRLIGEGLSGGEISKRLVIPRSTVYRRIKAMEA